MGKNNDLSQAAGDGADVMDAITGDTGNTADTPASVNTQNTKGTKYAKPGYYRFNLNLPLEYHNYLKNAAFNASTPDHIVTITEYISELIYQDMVKAYKKNVADSEKEGADNGKE